MMTGAAYGLTLKHDATTLAPYYDKTQYINTRKPTSYIITTIYNNITHKTHKHNIDTHMSNKYNEQ